MVCAADGIKPRRFQLLHAEALGLIEVRTANDTVVVVNAGSPQLDAFAVDPQSLPGIQLEGADAEPLLCAVQDGINLNQFRCAGIQIGTFRRPQRRVIYRDALGEAERTARLKREDGV